MRRNVLIVTGLIISAIAIGRSRAQPPSGPTLCDPSLNPACAASFSNELKRPSVAVPYRTIGRVAYYELEAKPTEVDMGFKNTDGSVLKTKMWGYNGQVPGPTLETQTNTPIVVKWVNGLKDAAGQAAALPFADLGADALGIDHSIMGAERATQQMVVHFHGGHSPPSSDGFPTCAYDPVQGTRSPMGLSMTGSPCQDSTNPWRQFSYPNRRQGTTLWYHDHGMGTTRYGVMAGLAGFYFTRDSVETALKLPKNNDANKAADREIPLLIQDRSFDANGQLVYATNENGETNPSDKIQPEFFGQTILVNNTIWPKLSVAGDRYRFRLLNGSNARVYHLKLKAVDGQPGVPRFLVIGSDGGLNREFLEAQTKNASLSPQDLLLAPGERLDVIIDFKKFKNRKFILTNDAPAPFKCSLTAVEGSNVAADPNTTGRIMRFDVQPGSNAGDLKAATPLQPNLIRPLSPLEQYRQQVMGRVTERWVSLHEDNGVLKLGDDGIPHGFMEPSTEKVRLGSSEIWHIMNFTPDTHPIHIHFVPFRVLQRQAIDVQRLKAAGKATIEADGGVTFDDTISARSDPTSTKSSTILAPYLGAVIEPAPYELGLKDVVRANPAEVTTIAVNFCAGYKADGFSCAKYVPAEDRIFIGKYVWHCHILEHEDNDMMRPLDVIAPNP
jgi:spore coat protein A, manganese oxidase